MLSRYVASISAACRQSEMRAFKYNPHEEFELSTSISRSLSRRETSWAPRAREGRVEAKNIEKGLSIVTSYTAGTPPLHNFGGERFGARGP